MSLEGENRRSVGVAVIGRNEGDRLRRCLNSVRAIADRVVYVDSGSIDDSVDMSRAQGVLVVELDMVTPFTAARARNAGSVFVSLGHAQFIGGPRGVIGVSSRAAVARKEPD